MTIKASAPIKSRISPHINTLLVSFLTVIMIVLGGGVKQGIYSGLIFAFSTIIPTLFPFFILSDLWSSCFYINPYGKVSRCFEKTFGINGSAITALICGSIFGFPIGVKSSVELYNCGIISKRELEHLCGFSNNPSLAFVISGIGAAMLGSVRLGIMLYLSVLISALSVGFIFRNTNQNSKEIANISGQKFNLVDSISSAGISSIRVCSFIVFFSGVLGLLASLIKNDAAVSIISTFLEVGNAANMLNKCIPLPQGARLTLIAFALGFSGFSVHLQAFSFLPPEISRIKYLLMKLIQGIVCAFIMIVFLHFI